MGHRFQGRQAESLVERRKSEGHSRIVETAQSFHGHESQKPDALLNARLDNRVPDGGVGVELIADDDEAQVGILRMILQFGADDREGLDEPGDILVWLNATGVEHEGIMDLIPLQGVQAFVLADRLRDPLVNGVGNDLDLFRRKPQMLDGIPLGSLRNSNDTGRPPETMPQQVSSNPLSQHGSLFLGIKDVVDVVQRRHVNARHEIGHPAVRHVEQVQVQAANQNRKVEVTPARVKRQPVRLKRKVRGQPAQALELFLGVSDQDVGSLIAQPR